jgi:CRP-like cAMP-binding protein
MVQAEGTALRATRKNFLAEVEKNSETRACFLKYSAALYAQALQTAACNGRHKIPARLARWLLEVHDRLHTDDLPLRHEYIAYMLGCRRASVTQAMGTLRRQGIIKVNRGTVRVNDRQALEDAACGCYAMLKSEFKRLFASPDL